MKLPSALLTLGLSIAVLGASPSSASALDVSRWDHVLAAHASAGGFDYAGLREDARSMGELRAFVASLASMPDSAGLADWLNAYDAIVVLAIAERHPIASVRDVPGFFDRVSHRVAGRDLTLDAMENQVIRARFHDARVHAALVCGARSCPRLSTRAFRAATLDATLTALAQAMVASPDQVRIENGHLRVSEIFFWFEADFRRDAGSVLAWLRRYDHGARLAQVPDGITLERIPYDWRLNDRRR